MIERLTDQGASALVTCRVMKPPFGARKRERERERERVKLSRDADVERYWKVEDLNGRWTLG